MRRDYIARIGRRGNPAERGLQLVIENADVLERVGRNLFASAVRLAGITADQEWSNLTELERDEWKRDAIELLREHVLAYAPSESSPNSRGPDGAARPLFGRIAC